MPECAYDGVHFQSLVVSNELMAFALDVLATEVGQGVVVGLQSTNELRLTWIVQSRKND